MELRISIENGKSGIWMNEEDRLQMLAMIGNDILSEGILEAGKHSYKPVLKSLL